ncbi:MAG: glycosyltransferase [Solirubrobacteraceae bacterium]
MSVLMGAYNYAQYVGRAIESALEQDYPPELLEIIVIDDGSTDSTAEVVAQLVRSNPDRIRLVRQANAGPTAATNRAIADATGELLCLLDADDIWLPQKTRLQVELLQNRPEVGFVFSDMRVIDANEALLSPLHLGLTGPLPERAFARILFDNMAVQSSVMIRASLRELFYPIPREIPYADWWLALRAAEVAEIDYVREPLALYRLHAANLTGGVRGAAAVREQRKSAAFQLWVLRHLPLDTLTPDELLYVWSGVERRVALMMLHADTHFVSQADVDPGHGAEADARLAEAALARERGDLEAEAALALKALAWDPFRFGARKPLEDAVARAKAATAAPHPLEGARDFVVLVDAEELLADDEMLRSYAEAMSGSELITLAIDGTRMQPDVAATELQALVGRCGLADRHDVDLLAVIGERDAVQRQRMSRGTHAYYRRNGEPAESERPVFTPASLLRLREFARSGSRARRSARPHSPDLASRAHGRAIA